MEDDNSNDENEASTSKKDNQKSNSVQDIRSDKRKYDGKRDAQVSNSESCSTRSYSARGRVEVSNARIDNLKPPSEKRDTKTDKRKKARRPGRVEKRKRSNTRRQAVRSMAKRKIRKAKKMSETTILSNLSSQSEFKNVSCKYCGHRCCRRRFEYTTRRRVRHKRKIRKRPGKRKQRRKVTVSKESKKVQAGCRSVMLSPLFVKSNLKPEKRQQEDITYCEISPEMIYQCMRRLSMVRESVPEADIAAHIKNHYPVNRNQEQLVLELTEKLRIAEIAGILTKLPEDRWWLNLQSCTLEESHVTKFWQAYADTLTPLKNTRKSRETLDDNDDSVLTE